MSLSDARRIEILLVDNDTGDVLMVREALNSATPSTRPEALSHGSEAISYLRREGDHAGRKAPIKLLDLNPPGPHGRQALADIRGDPDLRRIPAVVRTVSNADEDVVKLRPPRQRLRDQTAELGRFPEAIPKIDDFLNTAVRRPRPEPRPETRKDFPCISALAPSSLFL